MINLCLVVIATQFAETKKRETERMNQERQHRRPADACSSEASDSEPGGCYTEILRYLAHVARKTWRRIDQTFRVTDRLHSYNPDDDDERRWCSRCCCCIRQLKRRRTLRRGTRRARKSSHAKEDDDDEEDEEVNRRKHGLRSASFNGRELQQTDLVLRPLKRRSTEGPRDEVTSPPAVGAVEVPGLGTTSSPPAPPCRPNLLSIGAGQSPSTDSLLLLSNPEFRTWSALRQWHWQQRTPSPRPKLPPSFRRSNGEAASTGGGVRGRPWRSYESVPSRPNYSRGSKPYSETNPKSLGQQQHQGKHSGDRVSLIRY